MDRLLIAYATKEGQCSKIADFMAQEAARLGWPSEVLDVSTLPEDWRPPESAALALVASIHQGTHSKATYGFVKAALPWLQEHPTLFVSVSMSAADESPKAQAEARGCLERFLNETTWKPTMQATVAGALRYTQYNFFVRWIMKRIAAEHGGDTDTTHDHEYTNWAQVTSLVDKLHEIALQQAV